MRWVKMLGLLALLAGCAQGATVPPAVPKTIAAVGIALTAADQAALAYVTLPLCPAGASMGPNGTLCSQASISVQIKVAAAKAYAAYKAAELDASLLATAEEALASYSVLIPTHN